MKILVCIKQVPDMESRFKANGTGTWYEEAELAWRMNEYDEFAVEQAVQLKEKLGGTPEVVVVSVGPERVVEVIKKALAMGCDRGVHVQTSTVSVLDPPDIAGIIADYARDQAYDLIFTGMQSQDRGSAQVGVTVAEMLDYACATTVVEFSILEGEIIAKRELEGGAKGVVKLNTPALVTCQLGLNSPRYPTLPNIMKAKKKEIQTIPISDFRIKEPLTVTLSFHPPAKKGGGLILEGDLGPMVEQLVAILKEKTTVFR